MGDKLVLVDGSSYLFRAYHALPPLTTADGTPTGAVHGVLNMLNKLLREQATDHFAVVFDAPGKTFRDELYTEYKANRPPMPDDLREQIQPILDAVTGMGLPLLRIEGVEADDVIGTLCRQATDSGMQVVVSTSDKDIAQLVSDDVTLVNTMSDSVLDPDGVVAKFGVTPEQMIDYLALVGDSSDNIPGVPKVGPKTAAKWLALYGTVDGIIEHADDIKGKVGESLRDNIDQLRLSQRLATIRQDVELGHAPSELRRGSADTAALRALYTKLELRTLLRQLDEEANGAAAEIAPDASDAGANYETVLTQADFERWLSKLDAAPLTAVDTETTSLDYMQAELVGISLSVAPGEACYIPVGHDYPGAPDQLDRAAVLTAMRPFLEDAGRKKV
ncbi:MAG: 5'-3' exonuclease H3TH domain-containing protein, partial [Pseudomonadota bacterium]